MIYFPRAASKGSVIATVIVVIDETNSNPDGTMLLEVVKLHSNNFTLQQGGSPTTPQKITMNNKGKLFSS